MILKVKGFRTENSTYLLKPNDESGSSYDAHRGSDRFTFEGGWKGTGEQLENLRDKGWLLVPAVKDSKYFVPPEEVDSTCLHALIVDATTCLYARPVVEWIV